MMFPFKMVVRQHQRNEQYQVWTHENHAVEISSFVKDMGRRKMDYIHNNPVRAGWVEKAKDYLYSSARNYVTERKGLVVLDRW